MASTAEGRDEGGYFERLIHESDVGSLRRRMNETRITKRISMVPTSRYPPIQRFTRRGHSSPQPHANHILSRIQAPPTQQSLHQNPHGSFAIHGLKSSAPVQHYHTIIFQKKKFTCNHMNSSSVREPAPIWQRNYCSSNLRG